MSEEAQPKQLPKPSPICPICHAEMNVVKYCGYYESFAYWQCDCDDDYLGCFAAHEWRGYPV